MTPRRFLGRLWRRLFPRPGPARPRIPGPFSDEAHPERLAVLPYCESGHGIEIGCGHRKTSPNCIGVDLLAPGEVGRVGVVSGHVSVADIQGAADALPMFEVGSLDFLVSRHTLEHILDPVKALHEWRRVLRPGGRMAHVVPDESALRTIALDPTHVHAYTPESLARLIRAVGGFEIERLEVVLPGWSFVCVARRLADDGPRAHGGPVPA